MFTCNKPRIAAEIFHFDITYHVATYMLVGWGDWFFSISNLECNSDILHLLPHRILPKSVVILFVKYHTVIPALGNFNSELVSPLVVTFGYSGNTSTALLEDMWGPPHKIRGVKQSLFISILSNFNRVALLDIR
jgi:hypothetical protein